MKLRTLFVICIGGLFLIACLAVATTPPTQAPPADELPTEAAGLPQPTSPSVVTEAPSTPMEAPMPFILSSSAFSQGEQIPVKYSCDGEDVSPPLSWGDPPPGTQSLTLIMDDPDAPVGVWDHWLVFNIPADVHEFPENIPVGMKFGDLAVLFGRNSWGRSEYGGPCPPGGTHRYFFKLYALDTTLSLDNSASKNQLLAAMEGHILAEIELMGTFSH